MTERGFISLAVNRLTIRLHVSANFLRIASRSSVTRCARDVLSRDAPRETGCSRSAQYRILPDVCGTRTLSIDLLNLGMKPAHRLVICFANTQCAAMTEREQNK